MQVDLELLVGLLGVLLVLFNDRAARAYIWFYNTVYRRRYGEREVRYARLVLVVVGVIFAFFSASTLLGITSRPP